MPKFAANLTMLFGELEFLARFEAAARAGFRGVEYLFPYGFAKEELAEQLAKHKLTQVLHNLPAGDWAAGERGIACHPTRIGEFQDGVGKAIEYASALGCKQLNCLAGITPQSASLEEARRTFVDNLTFAAHALSAANIRLLIEPINTRDIPGFFLHGTKQALGILDEVASPNLFLQYDVYHLQIMEGDLAPTIQRHLSRIQHLQIADNPGRNEPGTGEINYPFLFQFIDALGYAGWIGCEYKPKTTTLEGLGWLRPYL
ncbi:MAG TPA: hydroxypyruvate isomerase [Polyangiaceae bacterium]|jgi:hydroxypyruvate isomerase